MKGSKKFGFVASAALVAILFAACADDGDTIVLPSGSESTGILVSGRGEIVVTPDVGRINLSVEVTGWTVAEAREQAAAAVNRVLESVKSNGVDSEDLRTTGLSIFPRYDYSGEREPRITDYTVSNGISITVRELDDFSEIIDEAVEAGGNDVRLSGISFDVEDARDRAEQLAATASVSLGSALSITEISSPALPPIFGFDEARGAAGTSTPIEPGITTVSVQVQVRWSIE